jgi:hypothetical protein
MDPKPLTLVEFSERYVSAIGERLNIPGRVLQQWGLANYSNPARHI